MKIVCIWQSQDGSYSNLGFDIVICNSSTKLKHTYLDKKSTRIWQVSSLRSFAPEGVPFSWRPHE